VACVLRAARSGSSSTPQLVMKLVVCATVFSLALASTFTPGTTCSQGDDSQTALQGKHLYVMELAWAPFASVDAAAPKGWVGYNIELMDEIAMMLGFTYEIVDIGYPGEGQTWTQHAVANIDNGDVMMSFWFKNSDRLRVVAFAEGHIDVSPGLIARRDLSGRPDIWGWESLSSFMLPFTWVLWGCLVSLVVLSGVADWVIERRWSPDAQLSASLYEYAAGFLWGGFEYPLTAASKVFQIFLGFVLLIIVSTYTANLAAFITLSASEGLSVTSVDAAMADSKALCMEEGAYNTRVTANYPKMRYELIMEANSAGGRLVESDGCQGVLAPKNFFDAWRTEPQYCSLEIVETLFPATAGWLGSKNNQCVLDAVNYALYNLKVDGTVDSLYAKYFPMTGCNDADADLEIDSLEEEPATRRRLRRRLKGGTQRGADASGETEDPDAADIDKFGVPRIGPEKMLGLLMMWLILTTSLIAFTYAWGPMRAPLSACAHKVFPSAVLIWLKLKKKKKKAGEEEEIGPDNEMAYLRELLKVQRDNQKEMRLIAKQVGVVKEEVKEKWSLAKMKTVANLASTFTDMPKDDTDEDYVAVNDIAAFNAEANRNIS